MQYIRASPVQKHKKDSNAQIPNRFNIFMVPRSPDYRNNLISAITLPFFANVFFLTAAFVTQWETVDFKFDQLYNESRGIFILSGTQNHSIIIRDIIQVIHRNGSVTEGPSANNPQIIDQNVIGMQFEIEDPLNGKEFARKPWCLMNFKVGIWQNCYSNEISSSLLNDTECLEVTSGQGNYEHDFWKQLKLVKGVPRCSSYMNYSHPPLSANVSTVNHFIKMQNNIISCAIVILLCASSALILGSYALVRLLVPGSMVCSVLYLTACTFVIFINIIYHIKVNKLQENWAFSYPISTLPILFEPKHFCSYTDVKLSFPIYLSWISSVLYFVSFCSWTSLTRRMNYESSKAYL